MKLAHQEGVQDLTLTDQAHLQAEFIHEMLGETSMKTIQHAA